MTPEVKDYLKIKLVETCLHLNKTEADKRASNGGFSEEIKGAKIRVNLLSEAINSGDLEGMVDEYGVEYVEELEQYATKQATSSDNEDI